MKNNSWKENKLRKRNKKEIENKIIRFKVEKKLKK